MIWIVYWKSKIFWMIAAIKHEYEEREVRAQQKQVALTDADVRRILHDELLQQGRFTTPSQQFGNLRI